MARLLDTLHHIPSKDPVLHYLGQFKTQEARSLILPYVTDPETRATAIKALARSKNPADRPLVEQYAHDPNSQVRGAVKSALKKLPEQ